MLKVMPYVMIVRYNSLEDRFISFTKLFSDTCNGLITVVETFTSKTKFGLSPKLRLTNVAERKLVNSSLLTR